MQQDSSLTGMQCSEVCELSDPINTYTGFEMMLEQQNLCICLSACLMSVCTCLSVYHKPRLHFALSMTCSDRDVPKSKHSELVNTKKACDDDFGPPW